MPVDKVHLRHCLLYEFEKGNNASVATENLCGVFGDDSVNVRTVQRWFAKFKNGEFSLEDEPRSGRPTKIDNEELRRELEQNPYSTSVTLGQMFNVSHSTILEHIHSLGFVLKYARWIPHDLTERNRIDRVQVCSSLLARNETNPFLDRLITGDEKWIHYKNPVRKRAYVQPGQSTPTVAKPDLHPKKRMLCIWWDRQGPVYYELLRQGETIDSTRYCQQLTQLEAAIKEKRPALANRKGIVFQHDNARPHASMVTQQKLASLGWEILPHPPYSPDIAPSDFYLFQSLQNFQNEDDVLNALTEYFHSKPATFFEEGINRLPARWRTVVENNGHYIGD